MTTAADIRAHIDLLAEHGPSIVAPRAQAAALASVRATRRAIHAESGQSRARYLRLAQVALCTALDIQRGTASRCLP